MLTTIILVAFQALKTTAEAPVTPSQDVTPIFLKHDGSRPKPEPRYETEEQIKQLIRETFPEESARAVRVAECESQLDPDAINPTNGSFDGGIFQISLKYHGDELAERGLDRFDIEGNVAFARILYNRNGWQDWSASKHCWYTS